jgi:hypothetical protein
MQKAVADDNRDRKAVYQEIAVANWLTGLGREHPQRLRQAVGRQRPRRLVVPGRRRALEAEVRQEREWGIRE